MEWIDTIFTYCERGHDPGLLAEPVNVMSNIAFLIAAGLSYLRLQKQPATTRDIDCKIFIVLIVLVGAGSTLFHIFARRWALVADVAPITVLILVYLNYALNRFLDLTPGVSFLLTGAFFLTAPALAMFPEFMTLFNGSIGFTPAWLVLLSVGVIMHRRGHPGGKWLLASAAVFIVALAFRTVDKLTCSYTVVADHTTGTHAVWHVLNAILLYMLVRAAIDHGRHSEQTYEVLSPVGTSQAA